MQNDGPFDWCVQTTDDSLAPLSINCWPSQSGAESYVNIEYEATSAFDLQTVVIAIPLPAMSHAPRVSQVPAFAKTSAKWPGYGALPWHIP
jgi:coatomer subunit delta